MLYLSFDIASRSLAFSFLFYNDNVLKNIKTIFSNKDMDISRLESINNVITESIQYFYGDVVDLNAGKQMKDMILLERTINLKNTLIELKNALIQKQIELNLDIKDVKVLLEYQMSANYQANSVFNQIYYEFSEFAPIIVNPCYKNKIYFSDDLMYKFFSEKYSRNYSANKAHSKENFLYFLKTFNLEHIIINIKKKNLDDIADSFMQIFAYINFIKYKN